MKKIIINTTFISFFFVTFFGVAANGNESVKQLIAKAPSAGKYPNSDAVILFEKHEIMLQKNGSVIERLYRLVKIFNEVGRSAFSESSFIFNGRDQKLKVLKACTYTADGKVVNAPANARNQLTPRAVGEAPDYCLLKQLVVSHTGLEENAVIELEVEKRTRARARKYLWGEELFNGNNPILEKVVVISVPKSVRLNFKSDPKIKKPVLKEQKNVKVFMWDMKNCPAVCREVNSPSLESLARRLVFSTCPSWDAFSDYIQDRVDGSSELPVAVKKRVERLVKKAGNNEMNRIAVIHNFFMERTTRIRCDVSLFDYRVRPLELISSSHYADSLDGAVFLSELLKAGGFKTEICFTALQDTFIKEVAFPLQFDDVIVAVNREKSKAKLPLFLRPWHSISGNKQLFYNKIIFRTVKKDFVNIPSGKNLLSLKGSISLNRDGGAKGKVDIEMGGYFSPEPGKIRGDEKKSYARKVISGILRNSRITAYKAKSTGETGLVVQASVENSGLVKKDGAFAFLSLKNPFLTNMFFNIDLVQEKRTTPLLLPIKFSESVNLSIKIPDKWNVVSIPESFSIKNKAGAITVKFSNKNGELVMVRELQITNREISTQSYPELRKILLPEMVEKGNTIIFKLP